MAGNIPKSLADLLGAGQLAALGAEARRRRSLTDELRSRLPREAAAHLVTASIAATGELVLTMDGSVWAARVRFLTDQISGERRVKVKVQPRPIPAE